MRHDWNVLLLDKVLKMTLRTRLVLALVLLATLGLIPFGFVTYSLYQRSLLQQLDEQLANLSRPQGTRLTSEVLDGRADASCDATSLTGGVLAVRGGGPGGFGPGQGVDAFSALYVTGQLAACVRPITTAGQPLVPASVTQVAQETYPTVGSSTGSGSWRLLADPVDARRVGRRTVGRPGGCRRSPHRRPRRVVEAPGAHRARGRGRTVAALALGAWLVLRRGLRPLETMSVSASTITAGDLSDRVTPADDRTEVGQLGLALNTMLDGLEESFRSGR